ncbi:MAG: hypothetical protein ACKO69_04095, partial [Limnohabitans sp.]
VFFELKRNEKQLIAPLYSLLHLTVCAGMFFASESAAKKHTGTDGPMTHFCHCNRSFNSCFIVRD